LTLLETNPANSLVSTYVLTYFPQYSHLSSSLFSMGALFSSSKPFSPTTDIPSLADKVILVTGGNGGLGKETILQLARHHPAKIYMGARSKAKAEAAISSITAQLSSPVSISYLPLDLASLQSIKTAAETINSQSQRLDIVILNAGIMAVPEGKTEDGFEIQLGTNHIGHFYLTSQLLPLLRNTAKAHGDARVVAISSEAYAFSAPFDAIVNTEKLSQKSTWARYGASKAANILFAAELARRYPDLTTASVHPGIIMTDLHSPGQASNTFISWVMRLAAPVIARDVPQGALNQLRLGTARKEDVVSGAYYTPVGNRKANNGWAKDGEKGRRLWEWSEREIKARGF
jgi:NAD(P)-dependent dehydrogenase (short-subunit alcohol dehydrogenase family)